MLRMYLVCVMVAITVTVVTTGQTPAQTATSSAPAATAAATFSKDVLPILQKNCQTCHRPGQIGPMALLTYEQVRPWARAIKTQVVARTMPPWHADPRYGHFINDRSLKQGDIDTIVRWVDSGATQGDPKEAPAPVQWEPLGWQIQPDIIVTSPAYEVPAKGTIEWETLVVPSPFEKDTWVTSLEVLPSDYSTLHHMCFDFYAHRPDVVYNRYEWVEIPRTDAGAAARTDQPGLRAQPGGPPPPSDVWVLTREVGSTEVTRRLGQPSVKNPGGSNCYAPGQPPHDYRPFEAGVLVKGGADLVFNLHYQTTGKPVTNTVRVGLTVANAPPRKKIVLVSQIPGAPLAIPPNEPNYLAPPVEVQIKKDAELVAMTAHMHYRGKDMTWSLTYPDGRTETILRVAPFYYNWQINYQTRVKVPAGTRMRVDAHYDNSSRNKFNPNPNVWVYWGNQAWEEMMVPSTKIIVDTDVDESQLLDRPSVRAGA